MQGKNPLLEIKNLHVSFRVFEGELRVLNGVDLTIGEGEKVGLVGETGCGKTTTIKSVLRVLPSPPAKIAAGEIFYRGKDILKMKRREIPGLRRGEISAIFQDPLASLNPVFTVGQQLQEPAFVLLPAFLSLFVRIQDLLSGRQRRLVHVLGLADLGKKELEIIALGETGQLRGIT